MLKISDGDFKRIASFIKSKYGVDLSRKRTLVEGRLGNYLANNGFGSYGEYFDFAMRDPDGEMVALLNRLTTNYTFFMREKDHFSFYSDVIMPWIDRELGSRDLRVWCAGCSTGQEAYTLALLTLEYLGNDAGAWEHTLLASDISNHALDEAKLGIYAEKDLKELPAEWRRRYFSPYDGNNWAVGEKLRKCVAFRRLNLLDAFSFKQPFQAIFCRNVMIYFDTPTKDALVRKYYDALLPGGYLVIGHSESLSSCGHSFDYVKPSVYRKPPK
ncbi:MAG: protein-glutamate O-methyltransferase CheR [Clostridiales Family XIII bacterium]|jgi:chemotaxis protein methyltransferase CheR|nr:protein-glutamate O-methyltransferase CheR [Clostridiales Family XIII bacterium]